MIGTTIETSIRIMSRWGKDGVCAHREGRIRRRGSRGARSGVADLIRDSAESSANLRTISLVRAGRYWSAARRRSWHGLRTGSRTPG
jgi:hypothetical protein